MLHDANRFPKGNLPGLHGNFFRRGESSQLLDGALHLFFFLKSLFIFREMGKEGEREGEKHQCVGSSRVPPTGDLACNPGMCPDWELHL